MMMAAPSALRNDDLALKAAIETARTHTLAWFESMRVPGTPDGVIRISAAQDPDGWPGMLLPGTYNGVLCRHLLDDLGDLSQAQRAALVEWFHGFRRADGIFRLPGMTDATVFKKPDKAETWRYIDFHITNYSLGALEAIAPDVRPVLDFMTPWLDTITLKAWLADRDLRDPWQEGNNIVNLGSFLLLRAAGGDAVERAHIDKLFNELFAWHDRLQEPSTGFWGLGQAHDPVRLQHAMAGSMHNYHLYYTLGRELPYQARAVDYALAQPTICDSACIDVDLVDMLAHAYHQIDYRRPEIEDWLRRELRALLTIQNPDGGFPDCWNGLRRQDGWVGGYQEPQGLSNSFATWFRWIAIAMISEILWPGWRHWNFRRMVGIGYFKGGAA